MTIIDFLNILHNKSKSWKDLSEQEQKEFNPFMLNRWLSMDSNYTDIINELQQYTIGILDKKTIFILYKDLLPKKKKYFVKYYKGTKSQKYNDNLISILVEYFQESKKNIKELLDLIFINKLTDTVLIPILKKYGKTDKEIKTLIKIKNI